MKAKCIKCGDRATYEDGTLYKPSVEEIDAMLSGLTVVYICHICELDSV